MSIGLIWVCLYDKNTINAIIVKPIIIEIKSPHMNFDFPIINDIALDLLLAGATL
jgi:hypothetical protein